MKIVFALGLALATAAMSSAPAHAYRIVPTPGGCSNAGDETSRPVYKRVNGKLVFIGYECIQDNRGGGGG
jgi:hypothetical protein